jgi:uncharacterized UPF0160 family protein
MKTAAVHHGEFHADDVFAVAILKLIYPELRIIRTRNPEEYAKVDARIDVGRKYNHQTKDYDHHQLEFNEKRKNGVPYASAGLIWKHYGNSLVKSVEIVTYLDQRLFQPIDANDVGVDIYDITLIEPYELSDVISILNPNWPNKTNENYDLGFKEAVEIAKKILTREIERANSIFSAREKIRKTIAMEKKKYIVLEEEIPWKETVVNESDLLFVVKPYRIEGTWWALAVPKKLGGFENRKNFPKAWAGLVNEDLAKVTGVGDAIFCHKTLFVAVARSKEGAIKLVELALRN